MLMRMIGDRTSTMVLARDLLFSSHCRHSMACSASIIFRYVPLVLSLHQDGLHQCRTMSGGFPAQALTLMSSMLS